MRLILIGFALGIMAALGAGTAAGVVLWGNSELDDGAPSVSASLRTIDCERNLAAAPVVSPAHPERAREEVPPERYETVEHDPRDGQSIDETVSQFHREMHQVKYLPEGFDDNATR